MAGMTIVVGSSAKCQTRASLTGPGIRTIGAIKGAIGVLPFGEASAWYGRDNLTVAGYGALLRAGADQTRARVPERVASSSLRRSCVGPSRISGNISETLRTRSIVVPPQSSSAVEVERIEERPCVRSKKTKKALDDLGACVEFVFVARDANAHCAR